MNIHLGEKYTEPGYHGYDSDNNDVTDEVKVKSTVNIDKIGNYKITYTLGKVTKTRYVNILKKEEGITVITLKGESIIYLDIGENYEEPGYIANDSLDGDITDEVDVEDNINSDVKGSYKVTYTVTNSSNKTTQSIRNVIVLDGSIDLSLSNTNYTNTSININVSANLDLFDYILLPDGKKTTSKTYAYKIDKNGTYKFVAYNTKGHSRTSTITVKNIDKTKPNGTCVINITNTSSTIDINATDNIKVSKYQYLGKNYTNTSIPVSKNITSANITILDISGNTNTISCTLNKKVYPEVIYYYQGNYSTAFCKYGCNISDNGCGATSLAMVASTLVDKSYTPPVIAKWMCSHGVPGCGVGMYEALTNSSIISHFGLTYRVLFAKGTAPQANYGTTYKESEGKLIYDALQDGELVIILVPNHFVTIGINSSCDNEEVYLYDPGWKELNGCYTMPKLYERLYNRNNRCTNKGWCGWGYAIAYKAK